MPVKLGPDGKVIEEKTHKAASFEDEFRQDQRTEPGRPPTDAIIRSSRRPGRQRSRAVGL